MCYFCLDTVTSLRLVGVGLVGLIKLKYNKIVCLLVGLVILKFKYVKTLQRYRVGTSGGHITNSEWVQLHIS